jgi:signal transduction histidine kinase/ActR/RegA family two-component response regulator
MANDGTVESESESSAAPEGVWWKRSGARSLRSDLLIAAVVPLAILGIGASLANYWVARVQQGGRVVSKLDTVASFLIDACELGLLTEAPEMLKEPVRRALGDPDIVYVGVYNARGEVLLEDGMTVLPPLSGEDYVAAHHGPRYRQISRNLYELHQVVRRAAEDPGREVVGFLGTTSEESTRQEPQGYVRVVMSAERVLAEYRALLGWSGAATAIVLVIGVALALALARRPIAGIVLLSDAARRIGQGELDVRVPALGSDEIARLASAFNQMSAQLRSARDQIADHQSQLERKVEERTRELNVARLEAERANTAKSHFLANISHEIRTPMTAILGFVDALLQRERDAAQQRDFLEIIRRNGTHLLELINTILDLSKLEAGRMELEQIECYPAEIAGEVVALLRDRAHQKNLAIQLESSPDVPRAVRSDPTRIRQILVNLVGNSVKFTHEGHVRIRVTAKRDDSPSRCIVQFSVIDTGIGIDPAQVASLFEPFAQGDTSHTRKYGGSGLGLAISKQLAGLMGGDLAVARGEDRGTCVTLSLPVMVVEPSAGESQVPAEPAPDVAGESPRAGLGRILLAEDTPDSRMLISLLISELGYSVDTAENGRIAVDKALETWRRGEPYAAILMDIQMPELDGYGATAELRDAGYEGPIVAVTAHAMGGSRERCLEAGCDDFLTKPINCEELAEILRAYLEKPGSAG